MANIPFYKGQNLNIIANLANSIKFDKTKKNKLNATNVQDAIDEIAEGAGITNVTRAQYNALTEAQKNSGTYFITDEAEIGDAASVSYVNDGTSLTSTNVQGAISELNDTISKIGNSFKTDFQSNITISNGWTVPVSIPISETGIYLVSVHAVCSASNFGITVDQSHYNSLYDSVSGNRANYTAIVNVTSGTSIPVHTYTSSTSGTMAYFEYELIKIA